MFVSTFHQVVPQQHILSVYDMHVGGALISVSLATMDVAAAGPGTRLRYTEQGAYVDGNRESPAMRKHGTSWHLDNLVALFK